MLCCPKICFTTVFRPQACSYFFLMYNQISGSCSYKIAFIKRVYSKVLYGQSVLICMTCLFWSTIGEIVELISVSNEGWSALLEKSFISQGGTSFPFSMIFHVKYTHYITIGLSATYFFCVSLGTP